MRVAVRDEVMEEVVYDSQEEQDAWPDSQPCAPSQKEHAVRNDPAEAKKVHKVGAYKSELMVVESRFAIIGHRLFLSD